jgi:ubiquitin carboxyl-terminal hydrolase 4/11/15
MLEYRSSSFDPWVSESQPADDSDDDPLPEVPKMAAATGATSTSDLNASNNRSSTLNGGTSYYSSGPVTYSPSNRYGSTTSSYTSYTSSRRPGETGLRNLGNTCFMNSALQCLSHCQDLTNYFLEQDWQVDINADNPIGQGGQLAQEFAELLRKLWSSSHKDVSPYALKDLIARVAPQFSGMQCGVMMAVVLTILEC